MSRDLAEPTIDEMLHDPIVRLRMARARVNPEDLRSRLIEVARRLQERARRDARAATAETNGASET